MEATLLEAQRCLQQTRALIIRALSDSRKSKRYVDLMRGLTGIKSQISGAEYSLVFALNLARELDHIKRKRAASAPAPATETGHAG